MPDLNQIEPPPDLGRMPGSGTLPADTAACYTDLLPGGRKHWLLPDGEVLDPAYDYAAHYFTGTQAGRPWASPWTPDLMFHIASQIRGQCRPEQGQKLHELAFYAAPAGAVLEIGPGKGLSSAWLGWGARLAATDPAMYCVDTFRGPPSSPWRVSIRQDFENNMEYAGLRDITTPIEAASRDASDAWHGPPVALLYVDGMHSYNQVRQDFELWSPRCLPGSVVAFDDCITNYPGVMRLQRELADDDRVQFLGRTSAMLYWQLK